MKPDITKNVIWNLAGTLAHLLAGFVVMPFLIRHLGQTGYGLWTLVASMTSYFGVLDLGTSGSVARNLAYYRSKNDSDGVNAILNSALAILCVAGGIAIVATFGVLMVFFSLFEVPQDQVAAGLMIQLVSELPKRAQCLLSGADRQTAHVATSTTSSVIGSGTGSPCFLRLAR